MIFCEACGRACDTPTMGNEEVRCDDGQTRRFCRPCVVRIRHVVTAGLRLKDVAVPHYQPKETRMRGDTYGYAPDLLAELASDGFR